MELLLSVGSQVGTGICEAIPLTQSRETNVPTLVHTLGITIDNTQKIKNNNVNAWQLMSYTYKATPRQKKKKEKVIFQHCFTEKASHKNPMY